MRASSERRDRLDGVLTHRLDLCSFRTLVPTSRHDYLHDEAVMTLGDCRVFQWLARFPDWVLDCDLMVDTPPELALTEDAEVTTADTDPGIARVVAQI